MSILPQADLQVFREAFRRNTEKAVAETHQRNAEKWFELCERTGIEELTVDQAVALMGREEHDPLTPHRRNLP